MLIINIYDIEMYTIYLMYTIQSSTYHNNFIDYS